MNPYETTDQPAAPHAGQVLTIQKLDPMSVVRMFGAIYGLLALAMSAVFVVVGTVGVVGAALQGEAGTMELIGGIGGTFLFAVLLPVLYGGLASVMGGLLAFTYNLAARWFGGISFTLG